MGLRIAMPASIGSVTNCHEDPSQVWTRAMAMSMWSLPEVLIGLLLGHYVEFQPTPR